MGMSLCFRSERCPLYAFLARFSLLFSSLTLRSVNPASADGFSQGSVVKRKTPRYSPERAVSLGPSQRSGAVGCAVPRKGSVPPGPGGLFRQQRDCGASAAPSPAHTDVGLKAEKKWQVWGVFYFRVISFPSFIN